MQLLVIRHGIAQDREEFARTGESDDLRPLTSGGRSGLRAVAPALAHLVPGLRQVVSSPLVRARQSAELVRSAYEGPVMEVTETLRPDASPKAFVRWLREHRNLDAIAAVGHEPHLGQLVSWLLARERDSFVVLKKGGACLLDFDEAPGAGKARLRWLATPDMLGNASGRTRGSGNRSSSRSK